MMIKFMEKKLTNILFYRPLIYILNLCVIFHNYEINNLELAIQLHKIK